MPRSAGLETLAEVVGWIRKKRLPVTFPFEYRTVAADDIWMSPMNAGPVAAISMHQYAKMPWAALFADAEAIFRGAGGRPHWAKRHKLSRSEEHTSELQSLMRISYAVFCLKKKKQEKHKRKTRNRNKQNKTAAEK